ncbi:hypothetical protein ACLOJK_037464 [Asimina triloba]
MEDRSVMDFRSENSYSNDTFVPYSSDDTFFLAVDGSKSLSGSSTTASTRSSKQKPESGEQKSGNGSKRIDGQLWNPSPTSVGAPITNRVGFSIDSGRAEHSGDSVFTIVQNPAIAARLTNQRHPASPHLKAPPADF